jgi:hypothetical protein
MQTNPKKSQYNILGEHSDTHFILSYIDTLLI